MLKGENDLVLMLVSQSPGSPRRHCLMRKEMHMPKMALERLV